MIQSAKRYHERTSYERNKLSGHYLDWSNQPNPFKEYNGLDRVELPKTVQGAQAPLDAVLLGDPGPADPQMITLPVLSRLFFLAAGLTNRSRMPGGEFFHRSVPSAGGLYPSELYAVIQKSPDLEDGVYHYSVARHALTRLRDAGFNRNDDPCLVFFITAIFFRSSWKYRDRSYRYHLLDSGHLAESLSLAIQSQSLPVTADYDFDDDAAHRLLGIDTHREVCLAKATVFGDVAPAKDLPPVQPEASRTAAWETDYPLLNEIHALTSAPASAPPPSPDISAGDAASQALDGSSARPEKGFADTVLLRRSRRNFVDHGMDREKLSALIQFLCAPTESPYDDALSVGILTGDVSGLQPGLYWLDRGKKTWTLSRKGRFLPQMTRICLDQEWLANAACHVFFTADLDALNASCGPRGYRYAMLTAGRLGHRIYLGATALELACCGIGAFYDPEAADRARSRAAAAHAILLAAGP
ncbi:MAG: SagB family peptide dehydrogenase [Desulfurivibrio sp.]|nr:SagB family peptide dehydrogenase [Desulfurivibrio sp.]